MIVLGRISGLYGVRGWVRIYSYTSPRDQILQYKTWYLGKDGDWLERGRLNGRVQGKGIVAQLDGCTDRIQAASLRDYEIAIQRTELPPTEPGEYYWSDLEGLSVVTPQGQEMGRIAYLFETGANDVIVVKGDKERLVPYISGDVVQHVDLEKGIMVVDWDPDF